MRQSFDTEENRSLLEGITYLTGSADITLNMPEIPAREPFDGEITDFLNEVSKRLMRMPEAKGYPDVVTFAFWIRKSSVLTLKERFMRETGNIRLGRGVAFHIAPSNVPVNYAYSLVAGLLTGNANIVRIPSKDFPQVSLINGAVNAALEKFGEVRPYICLVRYERDKRRNDLLSYLADIRIIWGGDNTIEEIRRSPLRPRACEITFADRYSLAVIDSEAYLRSDDQDRIAEDFYHDTFLTDQNACTSPRMVVWMGEKKEEAKKLFWEKEHALVKSKYSFQPVMGINKLTSGYLAAARREDVSIEPMPDNFIVRVKVKHPDSSLMDFKDHAGYFFEYDCEDIVEIRGLCDDERCQTIGLYGATELLRPLLTSGIKGVDRVAPLGRTMDFDLLWDGYNLYERLTRIIVL